MIDSDRNKKSTMITNNARSFTALHIKGSPLILYNTWDVGSSQAVVRAGARAVATSSWAVAAALGYEDGERVPKTLLEEVVAGIVEAVAVPVSVDFEGGYSENDEDLAKNVCRLMHLGAIGINFEDRIVNGSGLHSIDRQANRIAAIRKAVERKGAEFFINARTDLFLCRDDDPSKSISEAVERAEAYANAGASGFFIPGLRQEALIGRICERVLLPVNVMHMDGILSNDRLAALGVARISYGNAPYMRAIAAIGREAEKVFGSSNDIMDRKRRTGLYRVT